jgi:hypothetical protein
MREWTIKVKTVSEANSSEHWTAKAKRHKSQQFFVRMLYQQRIKDVRLPCTIILTRLAPRKLDDDNLVSSMKYIRDELSECIFPEMKKTYVNSKGKVACIKGRADSDSRITWKYEQQKHNQLEIKIVIEDSYEVDSMQKRDPSFP